MGTRARSDAPGATRVHLGTRVPLHATPARAWLPVPPGLSRCGTANGAAGEEGPAARPRGLYPGAQGWRNFRGRQRDARVAEERTTPAWAPPEADGGWAAPRNRLGRGGRVRGRAHRVAAVRGPQPLGHPGGPGAHCPTAGAPPGWPEGIGSRRDEPPRAVCGGAGGKQTSQTRHQGFLLSFLKSTAPRRAVKGPFPGWEGSGDEGSWGWTPAPWERRPSGPYFFPVLL